MIESLMVADLACDRRVCEEVEAWYRSAGHLYLVGGLYRDLYGGLSLVAGFGEEICLVCGHRGGLGAVVSGIFLWVDQ